MGKLSSKEKYENYRARIDSESYHELTPDEKKRGEENRRKLSEFMKKRREQRAQEAR
uniref:hypothetical protein n=1 Tax=Ezakiella massiliensis TaxID=1852374 RepID=UPI0012FF04DD|nr:hypothetical protein [Ezakiella massiliensis]